jgi:hypothetical protein
VLVLAQCDQKIDHGWRALAAVPAALMASCMEKETSIDKRTAIRVVISVGALGLVVCQLAWPRLSLPPVALGLVGIAILPWLSSILESAKFGQLEVKFREVAREQSRQRKALDAVFKFLVESFVTADELVHLQKLAAKTPFPFVGCAPFEAEIRRLLAFGLVERRPGKGVRSLFAAGDDVQRHLTISKRGMAYLEHRSLVAQDEND